MGWYTATTAIDDEINGKPVRIKRGEVIYLERRTDIERLSGFIVPGKIRNLDHKESKTQIELNKLGAELGLMPQAVAVRLTQLKAKDKETGKCMEHDEAVLRLRDSMSLLSDVEKIQLLAIDLGCDEMQANEAVSIVIEEMGCNMTRACEIVRARANEGEAVFTPEDDEGNGTGEGADPNGKGGETGSAEGNGKEGNGTTPTPALAEGMRVIAEHDGDLREGTIIKICDEGQEIRVKLDNDDGASYRRCTPEEVTPIEDTTQE